MEGRRRRARSRRRCQAPDRRWPRSGLWARAGASVDAVPDHGHSCSPHGCRPGDPGGLVRGEDPRRSQCRCRAGAAIRGGTGAWLSSREHHHPVLRPRCKPGGGGRSNGGSRRCGRGAFPSASQPQRQLAVNSEPRNRGATGSRQASSRRLAQAVHRRPFGSHQRPGYRSAHPLASRPRDRAVARVERCGIRAAASRRGVLLLGRGGDDGPAPGGVRDSRSTARSGSASSRCRSSAAFVPRG
jgi:hypothetical protein